VFEGAAFECLLLPTADPAAAPTEFAPTRWGVEPTEVEIASLLEATSASASLRAPASQLRVKVLGVGCEVWRPDDDRVVSNLSSSAHLIVSFSFVGHSILDQLSNDFAFADTGCLRLGSQPDPSWRRQTDHDGRGA
jgi:hypothetical protein